MKFESGNISLTVFKYADVLPDNAILLSHAMNYKAIPIKDFPLKEDEVKVGWTAGNCLLNTDINEGNSVWGGYPMINYRKAQRKIPPELLKATVQRQELAFMEANQTDRVPSKVKKEIKEDVTDRMLPDMPVCIKGVPVVFDRCNKMVYIGATSVNLIDEITAYFYKTFGIELLHINAQELVFDLTGDIDAQVDFTFGREFFTWLYRFVESRDNQHWQIEGPLNFISIDEPKGSSESVVKGGMATRSAEAKSSLVVSKRLRKAKFSYGKSASETWSGTFDADRFSFSGLSLPVSTEMDSHAKFEERMINLHQLIDVFCASFNLFYADQLNDDYKAKLEAWIQNKDSF